MMSIRHIGKVKRVVRGIGAVLIEADFPDRPRTFCVSPTNYVIGPEVLIDCVSGHAGPVRTGAPGEWMVTLSPPQEPGTGTDTGDALHGSAGVEGV
jgi:hypothetical protein